MRLRIGGKVREVESRVDGDVVLLTVDGVSHRVPYRRDPDGTLVLDVEGRTLRAWSDGEWAVADGRARRIERVAPTATEDVPDVVSPPMPAVVVKVLVAVGDVVKRGDRLVVVSAMKTETALKAPKDGVVKEVRVGVGQNVRPGDVLVELA